MAFWNKKKIPERDLNKDRQERQRYISSKLDESEGRVADMREAADLLGQDLKQGNLGAASMTADQGGFSPSVSHHLDVAEKHHRRDYRPGQGLKTDAESKSLAEQEIAKAAVYARRDLKAAVNKSKELRNRLRDI